MGVGLLNTLARGGGSTAQAEPVVTTAGKLLAYLVPAIFLVLVATVASAS